jgi:hypothetical protein
MWVYKSPEDVAEESKSKGKTNFFFFFSITFIAMIIGDGLGCNGRGRLQRSSSFYPKTWDEIIQHVPMYVIISLIAGLIGANVKVKGSKTMVCMKCDKTKYKDKEMLCQCGGTFEDIDKVKWVE